MKNIMKDFKRVTTFVKSSGLDVKPFRRINNLDGTTTHIEEEKCIGWDYFCNDDGIRYGNECFSQMIIPKDIFIEAFEKYIKKISLEEDKCLKSFSGEK